MNKVIAIVDGENLLDYKIYSRKKFLWFWYWSMTLHYPFYGVSREERMRK